MERIGPYEVRGTLGRGGSAVVYEVVGPQGDALALKLLVRASDRHLARFQRELEAMRALGSEAGFVPVLDARASPRGAYLVMPLLSGGSLEDRLRQGPLELLDAIDLAESLARALGKAHAAGLVHRDLKPANVLFDQVGRPLVSDLGLAKALDESQDQGLSKTGEIRGTLGYAPPEQLRDAKRVGPRADVFAIGATLWHCLAGRAPFGHDLDSIERTRQGPEPLEGVPDWLEAVIRRCVAFDPEERYADREALLDALEQGPRDAAPARSPLLVGVGALLALVGIAIPLGVALGTGADPSPRATPSALSSRRPSPSSAPSATLPALSSPAPSATLPALSSPAPSATLPPLPTAGSASPSPNLDVRGPYASLQAPLAKDLRGKLLAPVVHYSGGALVQSARVETLITLQSGDTHVLDAEGVLRSYRFMQGRLVETGWQDLRRWRQEVRAARVRRLRIHPRGTWAFVCYEDGHAELRGLEERKRLPVRVGIDAADGVRDGSFVSTDALLLVTGRTLAHFEVSTGSVARILERPDDAHRRLAIGAAGRAAALLKSGEVQTWDLSKKELETVTAGPFPDAVELTLNETGTIGVLARDGSVALVTPPEDRRRPLRTLHVPGPEPIRSWSWGRGRLTCFGSNGLWAIDLVTGQVVARRRFPEPIVACDAFQHMLLGALASAPHAIRSLDTQRWELLPTSLGHDGPVRVALESGGKVVSLGEDLVLMGFARNGEHSWGKQLAERQVFVLPAGAPGSERVVLLAPKLMAFLAPESGEVVLGAQFRSGRPLCGVRLDSGRVLIGIDDGSLREVDPQTGSELGVKRAFGDRPVTDLCALPEGGFLAASHEVLTIALAGRQPLTVEVPGLVPGSLAYDAQAKVGYAAGKGGELFAIDTTSHRVERFEAHGSPVLAVHASQGYVVSSGQDWEVCVSRYAGGAWSSLETLRLTRSGDRVTTIEASEDPREFLLGTSRGALIRCRWR